MAYEVGDVVYVAFPNQENPTKSTLRPAIIVEDFQTGVEVVFMTKQTQKQKYYPGSFVIEKESVDGKAMGLKHDSLIAPNRTFEVSKAALHPNPLGSCPEEVLIQIDEGRAEG